jgi:hypothetical protein
VALSPVLIALTLVAAGDGELAERGAERFAEAVRLRGDPLKSRPVARESAEAFAELRRRGHDSPALCRNEGNAWLLAGETARAILTYRHGLRLDPTASTLRRCLAAARERVPHVSTFGQPPTDNRPPWLPRFSFGSWHWAILFVLYGGACVAFTRWRMVRDRRPLVWSWIFLGAGVLAGGIFAGWAWYEAAQDDRPVVVIVGDEVKLRRGNSDDYPSAYNGALPYGAEARLVHRRGGWLQIQLAGGEIGWVSEREALLEATEPVPKGT